ncbi:hypothetical protein [Pelagicoccus mobilis]|uniref:Uncharacterized protein n=1 Tax=Pelagicoccus mobilis TaxID=415221 RepID=A0A934VPN4_9BACT|nr:hypothetical protein [Pelagicoccus mobilis]MBK1875704.1 hypothetical protein [Pelagicoccus mobilis]
MRRRFKFSKGSLVVGLGMMIAASVNSFPPAPHHLIKGMVRDAMGYPVEDEGIVYLTTNNGVKIVAALAPSLYFEASYRMEVPMDAGVAPGAYKPTALNPLVPFTMRVEIGSQTYVPIEMSGANPSLGIAGGTSNIDLTLGVDSDGDGLPDLWEESVIAKSVRLNGLEDVDPGGDLDRDGLSNYEEYLAHTYAYDLLEGLDLKIKAVTEEAYFIEFLVIDGHSYSILGSSNMEEWGKQLFEVTSEVSDEELTRDYSADDVKIIEVAIPRSQGEAAFFKLKVE